VVPGFATTRVEGRDPQIYRVRIEPSIPYAKSGTPDAITTDPAAAERIEDAADPLLEPTHTCGEVV
jgi:hypothetical protein